MTPAARDGSQHPLLDVPIVEHAGRVLDWRPRFDERSRGFAVAAPDAELPTDGILWRPGRVLDQGSEGACCGFAAAAELAATPQRVQRITNGYALGVYRLAQRIDQWPGEDYSGTSVLATMKVLRDRGLYGGFLWSFTVVQLALGLRKGPAVAGVEWRAGSYSTNRNAVLRPSGNVVGGHALCILGFLPSGADIAPDAWRLLEQLGLAAGVREVLEDPAERGAFIGQNSWGDDYGARGLFVIPWSVMEAWCAAGWECAHPIDRKREAAAVAGSRTDTERQNSAEQPATADQAPEDTELDDQPATERTETLELDSAMDLQEGDRLFLDDVHTAELERESVTVQRTQLVRGVVRQVRVTAASGTFLVPATRPVKVRRPLAG